MESLTGRHETNLYEFANWKKKTTLFLTSQSLSLFGSMLVQYAIMWHITLTTKSGVTLSASFIAGFLPQMIISLFAGVWADRYPRKLLIIAADALTAFSTLILTIFFLAGYKELWLIFLVSGIRSIGAGIQAPAVMAFIPQIVPSDRLMKVNSLNSTLQPIIMIVAPILSGALMSISRLEAIFMIDIVTATLAISLLAMLKVSIQVNSADLKDRGYLDDLKAGLRYVHGNRPVSILLIFFGLTFFLIVPAATLTPLLVTRNYGGEVWRLTANEVTFFAGSIVGGFILTIWGGYKNHFRTIGLACLIWAVLFFSLGVTDNFYFYLFVMFLAGLPMPYWSSSATTLLQLIVQPDMQGRVFGLQQLIMSTVMPLGMLIFGPIADMIPIETILLIVSPLMLAPGIWIFLKQSPSTAPVTLEAERVEVEAHR